MARNANELISKIVKMNQLLECLCHDINSNEEKIRWVKAELDGLLYQYYKNLGFTA